MSPDAAAVLHGVTVEFKSLDSGTRNAVYQAIRDARRQSRRAVIDCRDVALDDDVAIAGLADALRRDGGDLDEVVIIHSGRGLHWP